MPLYCLLPVFPQHLFHAGGQAVGGFRLTVIPQLVNLLLHSVHLPLGSHFCLPQGCLHLLTNLTL